MKTENKTPLGARLNDPAKKIKRTERTDDIRAGFRIVAAVPTRAPRTYYESIVIYVSGATKRLYVYNEVAGTWNYTALT